MQFSDNETHMRRPEVTGTTSLRFVDTRQLCVQKL